MPESNDIEMSEEFGDLIFFALDHGIESVRESGGPLIPFVMYVQNGELMIQRFVTDRLEDGPEEARLAIAAAPVNITAYALAYDGFITVEGTKCDAILVEASERGRPAGVLMAQRYSITGESDGFEMVGNPILLEECATLFNEAV